MILPQQQQIQERVKANKRPSQANKMAVKKNNTPTYRHMYLYMYL